MPNARRVAALAVTCVLATLAVVAPAAAAAAAPPRPPAARPADPGPPEWVGTYQRAAKDMVEPDGSLRDVYSDLLVTGSKVYRLRLPKGTSLRGGTPVRVRGRLSGADLTADEVTAVGAPARIAATGTTKVLVILAYWTAPDAMTLAAARNQVFTDDHGWYGEASYGQLGLTGDATGWHRIAGPTGGHCWANHMEIMTQAQEQAAAAGYVAANYDRTMVYFPSCGGDASGAAGWAYQPGTEVWLNGYFDRRVSVHEQGHNYGLPHAHTYHCSNGGVTVTLGGACSFVEYGDDYDAMGGSDHAAHFSAAQKDSLGWLAGRVRHLTSAETTLTLAPYEAAGTPPVAAVVDTPVPTRRYWMEYRQPVGYDSTLPPGATGGVLVHLTDSEVVGGGGPFLLDMSPHNSFEQAVIPAGGAWTSPEGVRISVGTVSPSGAQVTVRGGAEPPTVPSAPLNAAATGGDGSVRVSWDPPASNGGATVHSYAVTRTPGGATTVVDAESTTADVGGLTNGVEYAFTVAARNAAGAGPATAPVTAVPAAQLPSAVVTSPAPGATVGGEVTITATATPHPVSAAPIDYVSFEVDGVEVGWDYDAPYSTSWDSGYVADGPHTITATAYDTAWRFATSAPVEVEVRSARPTVAITAPVAGAVITDDLVTVEATAAPAPGGAPVESVTYELTDGTPVGYAGADAPHAVQWDTSRLDGAYELVATVYDADGRSGRSAPVPVTIRHPVPTVALTAPADGATVRGTVTLAATAQPSDESGAAITTVDFWVDGTGYVGSDSEAPYAVEWDTSALDGEFVLSATASDEAGRSARSPGRTVLVDNPLPTALVTSPAPGAVVRGAVTFAATAAAGAAGGSPVARVEFTLDGFETVASIDAPGPYTTTWDTSESLPGAEHTLVATAYDTAGRAGPSVPVAFSVGRPRPTVVVSSPADGASFRSGPRAISLAVAPDALTGAPVTLAEVTVDGVAFYDDDATDGFSVGWDAEPGPHVITARVYDAEGWYGDAAPVSVTVADPPSPPTDVAAVAGSDRTATLTWNEPAADGGSPVTGYVVHVSNGAQVAAAASPHVVTGLANGTRYTFRVVARNAAGDSIASDASNAVVPGVPTALTIATSASRVSYGSSVTVTGTLTRTGPTGPLGGRTVQLLACRPGTATCAVAKTGTTSSTGRVSMTYVPRVHRDLKLRYLGTGDQFHPVTSAVKRVLVRAVVSSAITRTSMTLGRSATVYGRVKPAHSGQRVYLQRRTSRGWANVTYVRQSSTGYGSFVVKPRTKGTYYYRLYFAGDADHSAGTSATRSVRVY